MAEPEKGSSSTGKDNEKHLDGEISKDFLTSWKSMSMTDGDDMDFNFEPVTKGNKTTFDFGKLDMDFSLDGDFGKLSSFKLDMPDLDFSTSPKKSTKSKEKSEDESVKENHSAKKNEFSFSFNFNGLDDFSLDTPSTKGGNNNSREKSSEDVGCMNKIECDDLHRQVLKDNRAPDDTINNRSISNSEELENAEENLDTSSRSPPNSEIAVDPFQTKGTQISSQKILAVNPQEMVHESDEISNKSYDQETVHDCDFVPDSTSMSVPIAVKSANTHVDSETKLRMNSQGSDKEIQATVKNSKPSYAELEANDRSTKLLLAKTSTQANLTGVMDVCSAKGTLNNSPSEACTDTATLTPAAILASEIDKVKPQKLSEQLLIDKPSKKGVENNKLGIVGASGSAAFALDIPDPSTPGAPDTLTSDTKSQTAAPRSTSKFFSASFRSGSTAAKPTVISYRVPRGNNSKFSRLEETNGGAATKLSMLGNNKEDTTEPGAKERREEKAKKLVDSLGSSTKILVSQDSVSEKTEKNALADNVFSGEIDEDVNVNIRDEVGVDAVSQDGQTLKDELVLQSEKINVPKSSSFQVPPPVSTGQTNKFSNQDLGTIKDKVPSRMSIPKSNFSEPNRLSSLRFGKKLSGLPSLKLPGNITAAKNSVSPTILENAKSERKLETGVRAQSVTSMISSTGAEKHRPSTPLLKRKPSEAADVGSIKLPPSKRISPNCNRVAKEVSATEVEVEVHTQGTLLEASRKNFVAGHLSPKFDFRQEAKMEELRLMESDANVEKAEACAKELEDICSMLKKKHEEAKDLLVRALVNNNQLLMLNHPIYEEKIRAVQKFAARVMSNELGQLSLTHSDSLT